MKKNDQKLKPIVKEDEHEQNSPKINNIVSKNEEKQSITNTISFQEIRNQEFEKEIENQKEMFKIKGPKVGNVEEIRKSKTIKLKSSPISKNDEQKEENYKNNSKMNEMKAQDEKQFTSPKQNSIDKEEKQKEKTKKTENQMNPNQNQVDYLMKVGNMAYQKRNLQQSLKYYQSARKLAPDDVLPIISITQIFVDIEDYENSFICGCEVINREDLCGRTRAILRNAFQIVIVSAQRMGRHLVAEMYVKEAEKTFPQYKFVEFLNSP